MSTGTDTCQQRRKGGNGKFLKSKNKSNPCTIKHLAKAWGVSGNFPLEKMKKGHQALASMEKKPNSSQLGVIDSFKSAKIHFSAWNVFIANCIEVKNMVVIK